MDDGGGGGVAGGGRRVGCSVWGVFLRHSVPPTTFAQLVTEALGVDFDNVDIVHGDTGKVPFGMGTYGSRSAAVGGVALMNALEKIKTKSRKIAAHLLEAAEEDIEFKDGQLTVAGTDRSVPFTDVAMAAYVPHNYPLETLEPGLEETAFYDPKNFTFPAGCHICEVEIDPDTGVSLGSSDTRIGDVEVIQVSEKYSIAQSVSLPQPPDRGDRVISQEPPPSIQYAEAWKPPKKKYF